MQRWFFETVNELNWGKFMVGRFDGDDWDERSTIEPRVGLLRGRGWSIEHLLVLDLQTGEGCMLAVRPTGFPAADLEKHRVWVCPMFEPFLEWLYVQDLSDMDALPRVIELPNAPRAMAGYRRQGPADE